jgi:protein-tyrosine phosphatase
MQPSAYHIPLDLPGRLWIMPRPKAEWLADEIAAYHVMGMGKIISLLMADEADELGLAEEAALCAARGMSFTNYPIPDRGLAKEPATFGVLVREVLSDLQAGLGVGIHCRAGIGRSGMLACSVLAHHGMASDEAIVRVCSARGGPVPDTDAQAAFIRDLVARMQAPESHSFGTSAC